MEKEFFSVGCILAKSVKSPGGSDHLQRLMVALQDLTQLLLVCQELAEEHSTDFMKPFLVACEELPEEVSTDFM